MPAQRSLQSGSQRPGPRPDFYFYAYDDDGGDASHQDEIAEILKDAGLSPADWSCAEKQELSRAIGVAETRYHTADDLRTRSRTRKRLALIAKTAKRLKVLLNDEECARLFKSKLPMAADSYLPRVSDIGASLNDLVGGAEKALMSEKGPQDGLKELLAELTQKSPFEILVDQLRLVFEKHTGEKAQVSRPNDPEDDTPYIRFVKSILKRHPLRKKYTTEAIIKATTLGRSGQSRRKAA